MWPSYFQLFRLGHLTPESELISEFKELFLIEYVYFIFSLQHLKGN